MIYEADSLDKIYGILAAMDKPIAVFDFLSGELGYEFLTAQVFGGEFFDAHRDNARVVALCWKGMPVAYQHVSHDQIEFIDIKASIKGNRKHQGGRRYRWLAQQKHGTKVRGINGVVAYHLSLNPSEKALIQRYKINQTELFRKMVNRLIDKQITFESFPGWRAILTPYILVFDRTDKHQSDRNTRWWQLETLKKVADRYDCTLAIRSGFQPRRKFPKGILHYGPEDRQLGLMCNLVRHALFFAGPVSGLTTTGVAFGCNFLSLGTRKIKQHDELMVRVIEERGFEYLGLMNERGKVPERIEEFLNERIGV